MGQQCNIMSETTPPLSKGVSFMSEHFGISDSPYVPPSQKNHLSEERLIERSPSLVSELNHVIA